MGADLLIDVSRLVGRLMRRRLPTGIDRVCLEYVQRFGPVSRAVVQWRGWRRIGSFEDSQRLFGLLVQRDGNFSREVSRLILTGFIPSRAAPDQNQIYLNVGHAGLENPGLDKWLRHSGTRAVYMVHDLIPLTHPEYCRPGEAERHAARMLTVLRTGSGVLANSEFTLRELQAFAAERALTPPRSVAAPLAAASLSTDASTPRPLPFPYFVALGTIEPRKNHWMLLHVWRRLAEELGDRAPHLVLIGQRGWECENVVDMLERCRQLRGLVHEFPACTDDELATYLRDAQALLFPSFAEGYGLPLVESLMLGTPAVVSDLPALREAAGEVPEYLDPLDATGWTQAVRDYALPDHPRRIRQVERLRSFRAPTWESHFSRVDHLLGSLA
jgi:glycosyltransferase involved in cell wall biosynthesis